MNAEDYKNHIDYMRNELKRSHAYDGEGRISGYSFTPDTSGYDQMTPEQIVKAYHDLKNPYPDR